MAREVWDRTNHKWLGQSLITPVAGGQLKFEPPPVPEENDQKKKKHKDGRAITSRYYSPSLHTYMENEERKEDPT